MICLIQCASALMMRYMSLNAHLPMYPWQGHSRDVSFSFMGEAAGMRDVKNEASRSDEECRPLYQPCNQWNVGSNLEDDDVLVPLSAVCT